MAKGRSGIVGRADGPVTPQRSGEWWDAPAGGAGHAVPPCLESVRRAVRARPTKAPRQDALSLVAAQPGRGTRQDRSSGDRAEGRDAVQAGAGSRMEARSSTALSRPRLV